MYNLRLKRKTTDYKAQLVIEKQHATPEHSPLPIFANQLLLQKLKLYFWKLTNVVWHAHGAANKPAVCGLYHSETLQFSII